jgi:hypothetical protein
MFVATLQECAMTVSAQIQNVSLNAAARTIALHLKIVTRKENANANCHG